MFLQIFLFEIKYRLRRPAFYIYFLFLFIFAMISFAQGTVPLRDSQLINSPGVLMLFSAAVSIFLMLVSSSIMGVPLYRDIEHNTKEYYLSYPITKAGYFWGRYLGSFFFVLLTGAGIYLGVYAGSKLGPVLGWQAAARYGPNHLYFYLYPFLTVVVPTLFFTSSLFFGLVAIFRNVKVIYSSGLFLFLGYILANFALHEIHNTRVIWLSDPFAFNGLRMEIGDLSPARLNADVIPLRGLFLGNRILWSSVGAVVLLLTYWRFSFERFFMGMSGQGRVRGKKRGLAGGVQGENTLGTGGAGMRDREGRKLHIQLEGSYYRKTLYSLTRIEILNIIRDNYFWLILTGGLIFLGFAFWLGPGHYGISDYPRTVFFMDVFNNDFILFIFFIIVFYTGETVHREKLTRYAFINDALPPPNWVLNSARLLSLCCLAVFLAIMPMLLGLGVQLLKGYTYFNLPLYFSTLLGATLPRLIEMVLFCYTIHIVANNKFAGHGIAITIWVLMLIATTFSYFNYNLLLYSYAPYSFGSDTDGHGHMLRPMVAFHAYWSVGGALLVVLGSLLYVRGVSSSFREKTALARQRFRGITRAGAFLLLAVFLGIGGYIYYNVSYLNEYLTPAEKDKRAVASEIQLKKYAGMPLPKVTRIRSYVDLYPEEQKAVTRAYISIMNKGNRPIDSLLLDGDNLTDYTFTYNGTLLAYRCPLYFEKGKFSLFRSGPEASDYRVYVLPAPLLPGDKAWVEVNSVVENKGFRNDLYATNMLRHLVVFNGGLPGMGYDDDEELQNNDKRKKYGLPVKIESETAADDSAGMRSPDNEYPGDLVSLDITVSTSGDQQAIAPGFLEKEWREGDRHYFHYVQDHQRIYAPFPIISSPYTVMRDTVQPEPGRSVGLEIYYHSTNGLNCPRYMAALKDGIRYYSRAYGPYPFRQMRVLEESHYGPNAASFAGGTLFNERFGWNADLRSPEKQDYCYYEMCRALAQQWWGGQVMPNQTTGAKLISDGVPTYGAILLMGKKYGEEAQKWALQKAIWSYDWFRRVNYRKENDLLHANNGQLGDDKTVLVLWGLRGLIGEDSVNAALREFNKQWAYRDGGVYAGSNDLYAALLRHVPDSFRYFMEDSWEKVTIYDNKIVGAKAVPTGRPDEYKVDLTVEVNKIYIDSSRKEHPADVVNDYIDIGVFATGDAVLYRKRCRLTAGKHTFSIIVRGKPVKAAIDPDQLLIDRQGNDNWMEIAK